MKTQFEKFIERNYRGLNYISIPNESFLPGVVLNLEDRITDSLSRIFTSEKIEKWKQKTVNANMANQSVSGERNLDLGVTLLGIVSLKGGFNTDYNVTFEFDEVCEIIFDTDNGGAFENEVRTMIERLKKEDRNRWSKILHEYVVMEVVVVKSVTMEFKRNGKVVGELDLPQLENELSFNGSYKWNKKGKMVIKNDKSLPFGVLGFPVKRFS